MKQLSALSVCTIFIAACSSTPEQPTANANLSTRQAPLSGQARTPSTQPGASSIAQAPATAEPALNVKPPKNSVYFDYDSSAVKVEYGPVVAAHARFLGNKRAPSARIEGNTDERGSREYNLALGQRRAEAVKQSLAILGVPVGQIEAISYGEEKPRSEEDTERAYAENRRADIVYTNR